ncbi:MAG: CZB domain-containing protein [Chromatiaceae bacterium]|nr:CZB domain-containing protein [Chromatiaceae bacterium]MCP5315756.1 CZB domain-containing protein [Chromatiaceae bacterium]
MNKKEALLQLRQAKSAHIQWRSYAQALIVGIPVEQAHVPVIHTDCKFGRWYHGPGQALASLSAYSAIDTPHEMLHQIYMKIFKLLFGSDDRGVLQKMFKSTAKVKKEHQAEAEELMEKLLAVSSTLLEAINLLEQEVSQMTEEDLAAVY